MRHTKMSKYAAALLGLNLLCASGCGDSDSATGPGTDAPSLTHHIVFSSQAVGGAGNDLHAIDLETMTRIVLTSGATHDVHPAISPDGSTVAFSRGGSQTSQIFLVDADGSRVRPITAMPYDATHPAWSPNGQSIAFASAGEIWVMNKDGSEVTQLVSVLGTWYRSPSWSPDGSKIAFRFDDGASYTGIEVMDSDGANLKRLTYAAAFVDSPAWSPDGARIAFIMSVSGRRDVFLMDADGSNLVNLTQSPSDESKPTWSPDGSRIAYSRFDGPAGSANWEIWTMSSAGSPLENLTNSESSEFAPHWSH